MATKSAIKKTAKKNPAKKTVKKAAPRKAASKKPGKTVKKPVKKTAKKTAAVAKKTEPRKPATAKSPAARPESAAKPKTASRKTASTRKRSNGLDLAAIRESLLELRKRVTGQISFLADDANHKDDTPTDDRTDDFDREFAFNLVSTEQDALYEIDAALRRLDNKIFGQCEYCNGSIEKNRLKALPFARHCLSCQSELERGVGRHRTGVHSPSDDSEHHYFEDMNEEME